MIPGARAALEAALRDVRVGTLVLHDERGSARFGRGEPETHLRWSARATRRAVALGTLGLGDAYVEGDWSVERGTLLDAMRALVSTRGHHALSPLTALRARARARLGRWLASATRDRTHASVRSHYDVGNEFFALWLDPSLTYTCAVAASRDDDLASMQRRKLALVCEKLRLEPGQTLLDLGCGWGSLALFAAERGAEVVAVNVSAPQLAHLERAAAEHGLSGRIRCVRGDLRDVRGRFDAVAAIGVAEHVGRARLGDLFAVVHDRLAPGGSALVHTIGAADEGGVDPWIERRIFPGSYIPTLSELARAAETRALRVEHAENLGPHYALTLAHWLRNLERHRDAIERERGAAFYRTWELYLAMLVPTFEMLSTSLFQVVVTRGLGPSPRRWGWALPESVRAQFPER